MTFSTNEDLLHHVESSHAFQCPLCPTLFFNSTTAMAEHQSKAHKEEEEEILPGDEETEERGQEVEAGDQDQPVEEEDVAEDDQMNDHDQSVAILDWTGNKDLPSETSCQESASYVNMEEEDEATDVFELPTMEEMLAMDIVRPDPSEIIETLFVGIPAQDNIPEEMEDGDEDENSGESDKEDKAFSCPVCDREYTFVDSIRKHVRAVHDSTISTCGECFLVFLDPADKTRHSLAVHGVKSRVSL